MDKPTESKFLMFENEKNNCWLDASVVLVSHNNTFRKIVDGAPKSQINKIISTYDAAVSILNDSDINIDLRIKRTQEMLVEIQTSTFRYLQRFLKHKVGEPDSAFCALLNLIKRDKSDIEQHLTANWLWEKQCMNCGSSSKSGYITKPIITLSKVKNFQPECPTSIYMCQCKTEQEMKLIYKELPSCLIFHFENGAGIEEKIPLNFTVKERVYQLTGVVILEKSNDPNLNHFVTWIRNPSENMWLDCNDLNTDIVSFSSKLPECNLKDIYMYVFESYDNLDKIKNEVAAAQVMENLNVEVIDLSDEGEEAKSLSQNSRCDESNNFSENIKNRTTATDMMQNLTNYSNSKVSKEEELMSKGENKSVITTSQSLVMADQEIHSDIIMSKIKANDIDKEGEKPNVINYGNMPIRNLRLVFLDKKNKDLDSTKQHSDSRYSIPKERFKGMPTKVEVKNKDIPDTSSSVTTSLSNRNENKEPSNRRINEIDKDIRSNEYQTTALNLSPIVRHQQDSPKTFEKQNYAQHTSSEIEKMDYEEYSSSKKSSILSTAKEDYFDKNKPSSSYRNLNEQQSGRNKLKHLSYSSLEEEDYQERSPRKRKPFHKRSLKYSVEKDDKVCDNDKYSHPKFQEVMSKSKNKTDLYDGIELDVKKQAPSDQNKERRLYSLYQSPKKSEINIKKAEDNETCYDEKKLHFKMHQTPLKKVEISSPSSSKKRAVMDVNEETVNITVNDDTSKTGMHKLPTRTSSRNSKSKKTEETQIASDREQDLKIANGKASKQSNKTSAEGSDDKSHSPSNDVKTLDRKTEKMVDAAVERTLAAFLEQIFFMHRSYP